MVKNKYKVFRNFLSFFILLIAFTKFCSIARKITLHSTTKKPKKFDFLQIFNRKKETADNCRLRKTVYFDQDFLAQLHQSNQILSQEKFIIQKKISKFF